MIALDTNVLVRFLVDDDVQQSGRAAAIVQSAIDAQQSLFVSDVVLCEVVWVLDRAYGVTRAEIAATLGRLLFARHLAFGAVEVLRRALAGFKSGRGNFADYVIREHALEAGCDAVVTFDRALLREPGFRRA